MPRSKPRKGRLDENVEDFAEEVGALGKRAKERGEGFRNRYYDAFGPVTPILSGILSLLLLVLAMWALRFVAMATGSLLLLEIHDFFITNLGVFFVVFLLSSFFSYCSRRCPRAYLAFSPFVVAFGITVFLWVVASIILLPDAYLGDIGFYTAAYYVRGHLTGLFWTFSVIGYIVLFLKLVLERVRTNIYRDPVSTPSRKAEGPRRLYRSGKDRILGGVCGGIAEYLGVDPVLIRLLWVLSIFVFGSGLLLYIIAWIIIPRNPEHKWD